MNELSAKAWRRLLLWRERWRYEFGRPLSTSEVMERHVPNLTWKSDRELLAQHVTAMPTAPARIPEPSGKNRVRLLGRDINFDGNWHVEPFFSVRWPRVYVGGISDFRPGSDVVLLWELNRMFFVLDRAAMFRKTGEVEHAAACFALMRSWSEQNRFMVGKNWRSPMEAGMRLVVWSQTLSMIASAELPDERDCGLILRSVLRQAEFLAGNFSQSMPPNNHLIGEAATLFAVATYWPRMRLATEWAARAEAVLEREAERQILSDGLQYEIALNYHFFVLDFFLLYCHAKALRGETPGGVLLRSVERMIAAVLRLVSPTGRIPRVGDDSVDEFFVLCPLDEIENQTVSDSLRFESFVRSDYVERLRGTEWGSALLDLSQPLRCNARFAQSGLVSIRRPGCHLVVTAGPQHDREFAEGHIHSDSASFELLMGRDTVVVDKGTYLYTYDPVLREHFRGAAAHNTVVLDGDDMMKSRGTFAWQDVYAGHLGEMADVDGVAHASISREITDRDGRSMNHVRIFAVLDRAVFVVDVVQPASGRSSATAQWRFHTPFECRIVESGTGRIVIGEPGSPRYFMDVHLPGVEPELVRGPGIVDAMFSRRYGEVSDGTVVRFAHGVDSGVAAVTVFHDGTCDFAVEVLSLSEVTLRVGVGGSARLLRCTFAPPRIAVSKSDG